MSEAKGKNVLKKRFGEIEQKVNYSPSFNTFNVS